MKKIEETEEEDEKKQRRTKRRSTRDGGRNNSGETANYCKAMCGGSKVAAGMTRDIRRELGGRRG